MNLSLIEIFQTTKIVPVAVCSDPGKAIKTAEMLVENSIPVIEITLRTETAFQCIEAIRKNVKNIMVGAGSVLSKEALQKAVDMGAQFGVAPCLDTELVSYSSGIKLPFIPGIATPSELNIALKSGLKVIKVFPASNLGGVNFINAITAPFKMYKFYLMPTGGINENNIREYFTNPNVAACGATSIVESALIDKGDFETLKGRIKRLKELLAN